MWMLTACLLLASAWYLVPHPALVIIASIVPLALVLVIRLPFLMVLLFVVFSFFRIHEVLPQLYHLKIPLLLSLASLITLSWHIGLSGRVRMYWRPEFTMISVFFILTIIGVVSASNRPVAINYLNNVYWKIMLMTFAIAWLTRESKDFALASRAITLSGLLVGIVALMNKIKDIGLVEGTRVTIGRDIGSVLGDPNDLALVLMFPMSFAVALLTTPKLGYSSRILGIAAVIVLFSAVVATQSRGGLLGILTILAVYGYRHIRSKALLGIIGALLMIIMYAAAGISDRASGGAAEQGIDASAMGRLYAWEAAIGMAIENPVTGVGLDNFYSNYYFYSPHWDGLNHAVHSTWFGILAETGFLGLAVFILTIVMLIRTSHRSLATLESQHEQIDPALYATAQALLAGLYATAVSGTFLTQGFTWPIYILAALVIALAHWIDKNLPAQGMASATNVRSSHLCKTKKTHSQAFSGCKDRDITNI